MILPIKFRRYHPGKLSLSFWMVTFLKNFGPWKKDDKFWHITLDFSDGKISSWSDAKTKTMECDFEIKICRKGKDDTK